MADNIPNVPPGAGATPPAGPTPPTPAAKHESGKIQPKKETVRINLPPKPTAAPTIKIPSPSAISAAAPAAAAPAAAPSAAPSAAAPAAAPVQRPAAAPATAARPAAAPMTRAAAPAAAYGSGIDAVDKGLAIATAVISLVVLVRVFMLASG